MSTTASTYAWQWPSVGATPINQGMDSEIFDTKEVPHAQTFVREAVQNSLDARMDKSQPVRVRFAFKESHIGDRSRYLGGLIPKRAECRLEWPDEWDAGRISWLVVEDFNSTGLLGDLSKRSGDFWNYWLNFGVSNKSGSGRGGRGIGRVTFLIASEVNAVIGLTRRADGMVAACGMGVLRAGEHGDDYRVGYAYLASKENKNIYDLYEEPEFWKGLVSEFGIADRVSRDVPGLSLILPYPRAELTPAGIMAAAIEHFGPAIIDGSLVVDVDEVAIDSDSIDEIADQVAAGFGAGSLRENPVRVLDLQRRASERTERKVNIRDVSLSLAQNLGEAMVNEWRGEFERTGLLVVDLGIPVRLKGATEMSRLQAAVSRTPYGKQSADLFFRGGMCLPKVVSKRPADIDLVVQAADGSLVPYLNLCEGKAHLDLTEHQEVRTKLKEAGFETNFAEKRFVRRLMDEIRGVVLPDASVPDISVFARYFSAPRSASPAGARKAPKGSKNNVIVPEHQPRLRALIVDSLQDGFRIRANPEFKGWPINVRVEAAYADGSRRPAWSKLDFDPSKLPIVATGASGTRFVGNVIHFADCTEAFSAEVTGFDIRRELVTNVEPLRPRKPASGVTADA